MSISSETSLERSLWWLIVVAAVVYWGSDIRAWLAGPFYAFLYGVSEVHVDARPKDCDFMQAPLGSKGCHYKMVVTAYNATGDQVGGDDAPRYNRDTQTGKPIISWDHRKTWQWMPSATDVPDPKIKSVYVSFIKITD